MDMTLTPAQEEFLAGFQAYLNQLDLDLGEVRASFETDPMEIVGPAREFVRQLGRDGWLGMGWPTEYGGGGRSAVEQWLVLEELAYRRLPSGNLTTSSLGPTLARLGTDEQRERFLPGILAGDIDFAIGYSEPEAGTDLASLTTRATRQGDNYLVDGQKIYTTGAHVATHLWLAVRTGTREDRHRGLTILIVPLPSAGVEITPILTQGDERTNQVFLTDVVVPVANRVGEENGGWTAITTQLNFERLFCYSDLRNQFDLVLRWAGESGRFDSALVRASLAEMAADLEVSRLFCLRAAWLIDHGQVPMVEASMNKVWYSELRQRLSIASLDIMGPAGQVRGAGPLDGRMERAYRASTVIKFGAGTNEVQRDIIGRRTIAGKIADFALEPELAQLREASRAYLTDYLRTAPVTGPEPGYDPKLWSGGLRLGWLSAACSVTGGGPVAAGVVAAEIGRAALPVPLLSGALAVALLDAAGAATRAAELAAEIEQTGAVVAVLDGGVRATRDGNHWVISGPATVVEWAAEADRLICIARSEDGPLVLDVPRSAAGLSAVPVDTMDHQPAAVCTLRDVRLEPDRAFPGTDAAVDAVLAAHRLLRAMELAGGARAVLEMTCAHVARRHQFGVPLASFQAVQHIVADMATHVDAALAAAGTGLRDAQEARPVDFASA
ncbi:MAG TPA: acyl-CoA dehydrogenase family protein, partial [Pseudonocardia sp.]